MAKSCGLGGRLEVMLRMEDMDEDIIEEDDDDHIFFLRLRFWTEATSSASNLPGNRSSSFDLIGNLRTFSLCSKDKAVIR